MDDCHQSVLRICRCPRVAAVPLRQFRPRGTPPA
jgi:hypothetical protein